MEVAKQIFRRLNYDNDVNTLQPGDCVELKNCTPVAPLTFEKGNVINLFGNAEVVNSDLPAGTNTYLGNLEDVVGQRVFYFIHNSNNNHSIYQYSGKTGLITRVSRDSIWGFSATKFITGVDILGDILVFTDDNSDIKRIDVAKAIAGGTYSASLVKQEITLIRRPPATVLTWALVYDIAYANNFVSHNYFQFFHRFIYENNECSVFGGASKSCDGYANPSVTVDCAGVTGTNYVLSAPQTIDNFNAIAGTRVLIKNNTDPTGNGIWVVAAGAWTRATDADTDAEIRALAGVYVKFGRENGSKLYKNINTSAITIGVTAIRFSLIEGPNAIDVTTSTTDIPATVKRIEYAVRVNGSNEYAIYRIDDAPLGGATHRFYNDTFLFTVPVDESVKWNDAIPPKARGLKLHENRIFLLNNTEGYTHSTAEQVALTLTTTPFVDARSFRHFKDGGTYSVGLVFFDFAGRFIGAVHCADELSIPYRNNPGNVGSVGDPPYIISVGLGALAMATIPLDATDYAVVVTPMTNKSFFINYLTADIFYYITASDGTTTYTKTAATNANGMAIDIITLTQEEIGYTFTKGDRIRIAYQPAGDNPIIVDTEITGQDGRFVLTRSLTEFAAVLLSTNDSYWFEIYRPKATTAELFFEVGEKYAITSPGGGSRAFSTTTITPVGDVSTVLRNFYLSASGGSATDPFGRIYTKGGERRPFEAMNSSDKKFEQWVQPGARSITKNVIDSVQTTKATALRFGDPLNQTGAINPFASFGALNEQVLEVKNGIGQTLRSAGNVLVATFQTENVSVYVGEGFVKTTSGNSFLAKTDNVIGDDQRNLGSHGTMHTQSVVERGGRVYYLDMLKGAIIRRSNDGLTRISEYGIAEYIAQICREFFAYKDDPHQFRAVGGWDPVYKCYVLDIDSTDTGAGGVQKSTLYFHEDSNSWIFSTDMHSLGYSIAANKLVAFGTAGKLWLQTPFTNYNNFFGVQYNRQVRFRTTPKLMKSKQWIGFIAEVETIYTPAGVSTIAPSAWTNVGVPTFDSRTGTQFIEATGWGGATNHLLFQAAAIPAGSRAAFVYEITIAGAWTGSLAMEFTLRDGAGVNVGTNETTDQFAFASGFTGTIRGTFRLLANTTAARLYIELTSAGVATGTPTVTITLEPQIMLHDNETVVTLAAGDKASNLKYLDFEKVPSDGGVFKSSIFRQTPDSRYGTDDEAKYNGEPMRGQSLDVTIVNNSTSKNAMKAIDILYQDSELSFP